MIAVAFALVLTLVVGVGSAYAFDILRPRDQWGFIV